MPRKKRKGGRPQLPPEERVQRYSFILDPKNEREKWVIDRIEEQRQSDDGVGLRQMFVIGTECVYEKQPAIEEVPVPSGAYREMLDLIRDMAEIIRSGKFTAASGQQMNFDPGDVAGSILNVAGRMLEGRAGYDEDETPEDQWDDDE